MFYNRDIYSKFFIVFYRFFLWVLEYTHRVRRRSLVAKQHEILLIFFWIVKLTGQSSNPQKFLQI
jgi:hypothetical protein